MEPTGEQLHDWMRQALKTYHVQYGPGVRTEQQKVGIVAGEVARLAYQAGAEAELDGCASWVWSNWPQSADDGMKSFGVAATGRLRMARRPPPSRKSQALSQLQAIVAEMKRHGLNVPDHQALNAVIEDSPDD
jgi:hypothetical protein